MFCPRRGWSKGAGRGALSLLRRTAPLPAGVFGWSQSTQTAVWPELVVILAPGFDELPGFSEAEEKMFIEAYMDPASAQGCFSTRRIGCLHISGLLLG